MSKESVNTCQDCVLFLPIEDTKPIKYLRAKLKDCSPWRTQLDNSQTGLCQSMARLVIVNRSGRAVVECPAVLSTAPSCENFLPRRREE
ncbi:MAG: hypothetical protein ACOX6N_02295 [Patescibacteria group bacterium]